MATLVASPCVNAGALCHHQPSLRGPQQLSTSGIPLKGSLLGLKRRVARGSDLTRRAVQGGPRADSETEGRAEGNGRPRGLDELDNQLRSLSSSDDLMSDATQSDNENVEKLPRREEQKRVDWPVFGEGFAVYIGGGLILLTIINNILFRIFLGPPVPRSPLFQGTELPEQTPSDGARRERYRLRSYKDPKYLQRDAPSPGSEKPLS